MCQCPNVMSNDAQLQTFLRVMKKEGERGRLWPGLGQEVRVRVETMMRRSMEIIVLDVDPESDKDLVRQAMEKYGDVKRCERMRMSGIFHKVVVNKVKVEIVRNEVKLPNIIHAFGTTTSADDFATWKMEYRGCPRYCYGCGATSHEARQCGERGISRGRLEKMASVVGEEQGGTGAPLSYAAVLKDPTFLARQKREREEEKQRREERSAREDTERRERTSREAEEAGRAAAEREWEERRGERAEREQELELRELEQELEEERREREELEEGRREGLELEEREQGPPPPEGNTPPPPKSGEVKGVPGVEEEVPRMVVEGAKGAEVGVVEAFRTPSQPRESRGTKKEAETKRPQVLKRGSSAEMEPGKERDDKIIMMEEELHLTKNTRSASSNRSEGGPQQGSE